MKFSFLKFNSSNCQDFMRGFLSGYAFFLQYMSSVLKRHCRERLLGAKTAQSVNQNLFSQNCRIPFKISFKTDHKNYFLSFVEIKVSSFHWALKRITIIRKIFETNLSFHVKYRTTEKVQFLLFRKFLLALTKFSFQNED